MDIHIFFKDTIFRPGLSRSSSGINCKSLEMVKNDILTKEKHSPPTPPENMDPTQIVVLP